jgi:hypothetical protein
MDTYPLELAPDSPAYRSPAEQLAVDPPPRPFAAPVYPRFLGDEEDYSHVPEGELGGEYEAWLATFDGLPRGAAEYTDEPPF